MSVEHDARRHRFHLPAGRGEAYLDYRVVDAGTLDFRSTYVDPALRGRGLAAEVVKEALDHARASGKRIVPTCSYVRAYLRRHPEYADLEVSKTAG